MMKCISRVALLFLLSSSFFAAALANSLKPAFPADSINRIEGIVWDPYRHPVPNIYVELQNENYSTLSRTRTDSTGRFSFIGVSSGHFNIKVLTSGTNYLEYTEGIDVVNVLQGSSDSVYL